MVRAILHKRPLPLVSSYLAYVFIDVANVALTAHLCELCSLDSIVEGMGLSVNVASAVGRQRPLVHAVLVTSAKKYISLEEVRLYIRKKRET
jgi:hypothetical protein